jgi:hypothetical protein
MIKNLILISVLALSVMSSVAWSQDTLTPRGTQLPDKIILTTEGSAKDFTPIQKEFLQAALDDLCYMNAQPTADHLNRYIASGVVRFGKIDNPGTVAQAKCNTLGYLDPRNNLLTINEYTVNTIFGGTKEAIDKAQETGKSNKEKEKLQEYQRIIRDMAFTMVHEDKHMEQWGPDETPYYEDDAYATAIDFMRQVINSDMQKIRDILSDPQRPGNQDKLNVLILNLDDSREVYKAKIDSMQADAIKNKKVTPSKFENAQTNMEKLYEESGDLIKSSKGLAVAEDQKPPGGSFKITKVEHPSLITSDGAKGDLTIYWSGMPVFPVKVVYRPNSCATGVKCFTEETKKFDKSENPLVFPGALWCSNCKGIHFDYVVVMIDARGVESVPYPAPFTGK